MNFYFFSLELAYVIARGLHFRFLDMVCYPENSDFHFLVIVPVVTFVLHGCSFLHIHGQAFSAASCLEI